MFTDEEKEYVLLAYYLGRKKLLSCIALQQLTKDILDVFEFERQGGLCHTHTINPVSGCCLCKEKENIFKDFWEYYFMKDDDGYGHEISEGDVERAWTDVLKLWKDLEKYDGTLSGRQLILNYEKAGEALMKAHNVKVHAAIKEKYDDQENFCNWSRIIRKVQDGLHSLQGALEKVSDMETPAQVVHKASNSGESVRVAPITMTVQGDAAVLANYAMQRRSYGIEAVAESPTTLRIKYMICLKCSMDKDYSQPISATGLHSKYYTACRRMFLGFEKKLGQMKRSGQAHGHVMPEARNGGFAPNSEIHKDKFLVPSVPVKKLSQNFAVKSIVTELPSSTQISHISKKLEKSGHRKLLNKPKKLLPPSKKLYNEHKLSFPKYEKPNYVKLMQAIKHKHSWMGYTADDDVYVRYLDDKFRQETLTDTIYKLEQFRQRFSKICELRHVVGMRGQHPQPDMPIMRNFKVHRPKEGGSWPTCNQRKNEQQLVDEEVAIPATHCPVYRGNISEMLDTSFEIPNSLDFQLFPEVNFNQSMTPFRRKLKSVSDGSCESHEDSSLFGIGGEHEMNKPSLLPSDSSANCNTLQQSLDNSPKSNSEPWEKCEMNNDSSQSPTISNSADFQLLPGVNFNQNTAPAHNKIKVKFDGTSDSAFTICETGETLPSLSFDSSTNRDAFHQPFLDHSPKGDSKILVQKVLPLGDVKMNNDNCQSPTLGMTITDICKGQDAGIKADSDFPLKNLQNPDRITPSDDLDSSNGPSTCNDVQSSLSIPETGVESANTSLLLSNEEIDEAGGNSDATRNEFSTYVAEYLAKFVTNLDDSLKSYFTRRQRSAKGKIEPMKSHFSHYLCSSDKSADSLTIDFSCSKMVRVAGSNAALARKYKDCPWIPKALSRLSKLVLHEEILQHKQSLLSRQSSSKNGQKKPKNSKSKKSKAGSISDVNLHPCAHLKSQGDKNPKIKSSHSSTREKESVNIQHQSHAKHELAHLPSSHSTSPYSINGQSTASSGTSLLNSATQISPAVNSEITSNEISNTRSDHCEPNGDGTVSSPENNKQGSVSCIRRGEVSVANVNQTDTPDETMLCGSPQKLKIRYKRDCDGNWKSIDGRKLSQITNNSLKICSAQTNHPASSEFHHKLSTISHHKPPAAMKCNRSQGVVREALKTYMKSKDKRKKMFSSSYKSFLFSSSYSLSFEEVGFLPVAPSPAVFHEHPNLRERVASKRARLCSGVTKITKKIKSGGVVSHSSANNASIVRSNGKPSQTVPHNRHLSHNALGKIVDARPYMCTVITSKEAEFAVSALSSPRIPPVKRCTSEHSDTDQSLDTNAKWESKTVLELEKLWAFPSETVPCRDVIEIADRAAAATINGVCEMNEVQTDRSNNCVVARADSVTYQREAISKQSSNINGILETAIKFPMDAGDCCHETEELEGHPTYESVLTSVDNISRKLNKQQPCGEGFNSNNYSGASSGKLWQANGKLSSALKFCFANPTKTPVHKRTKNKKIGKALVDVHNFSNRVKAQRMIKKRKNCSFWWEDSSYQSPAKDEANGESEDERLCKLPGYVEQPKVWRKLNMGCSEGTSETVDRNCPNVNRAGSSNAPPLSQSSQPHFGQTSIRQSHGIDTEMANKWQELPANQCSKVTDQSSPLSDSVSYGGSSELPSCQRKDSDEQCPAGLKGNRKRRWAFVREDDCKRKSRMKAIIRTDEMNMQRRAKNMLNKHNAGCLQSLFESSLNVHLVTRVFYDSDNAKPFSLAPPVSNRRAPETLQLGDESLSLLKASRDEESESTDSDASGGGVWSCCDKHRPHCAPLAATPASRCECRLPSLLRFKDVPCVPKGLGNAKRVRSVRDSGKAKHTGARKSSASNAACPRGKRTADSKSASPRKKQTVNLSALKNRVTPVNGIYILDKIPVIRIPKC